MKFFRKMNRRECQRMERMRDLSENLLSSFDFEGRHDRRRWGEDLFGSRKYVEVEVFMPPLFFIPPFFSGSWKFEHKPQQRELERRNEGERIWRLKSFLGLVVELWVVQMDQVSPSLPWLIYLFIYICFFRLQQKKTTADATQGKQKAKTYQKRPTSAP